MTPAVEQLVRQTMELTGAPAPALWEDDTPALLDQALSTDQGFYLIGIIGGKDVGKSALVNALAGRPITAITSHGPGTQAVVAYAHVSLREPLERLLNKEVPGRFAIIAHEQPELRRQVLLDLPDIDSHFESHAVVTRAMLRHMLFPIWMQSIEKYADRQPQQMLAKVAAGNSPRNFLFCLNKVDQLAGHADAEQAGEEIRQDFARRLMGTLSLDSPPAVFLISALSPQKYDLPRLRELLGREKTSQAVQTSRQLAVRQQDRSALAWLESQDLAQRAARLERLYAQTQELVMARVGEPLLEQMIPALFDDPANRLAMIDDILRRRVVRWPLVGLVHTLLSPLLAVWRSNIGATRAAFRGPDALVEAYVDQGGRRVAGLLQSAFAQVRSSSQAMAELYAQNHLWEDMPADLATGQLRDRMTRAVERQHAVATDRLSGRGGLVGPLFRWMLTIGALLWFPLVQPLLGPFLRADGTMSLRELAGTLVSILSGEALLKNVSFLLLWFLIIWLSLRWSTQRRLSRLLARWRAADYPDESLNLTAIAMHWLNDLTHPLRESHAQSAELAGRVESLRNVLSKAA